MNNATAYPNMPSVYVERDRYDELLHKEAMLDAVMKLHNKLTDYAFRDAVGYLFKADAAKADE